MRDHTKLRAFELADEIALSIYRISAGFPSPLPNGFLQNFLAIAVEAFARTQCPNCNLAMKLLVDPQNKPPRIFLVCSGGR